MTVSEELYSLLSKFHPVLTADCIDLLRRKKTHYIVYFCDRNTLQGCSSNPLTLQVSVVLVFVFEPGRKRPINPTPSRVSPVLARLGRRCAKWANASAG